VLVLFAGLLVDKVNGVTALASVGVAQKRRRESVRPTPPGHRTGDWGSSKRDASEIFSMHEARLN
jgi:hypothetical protein